MYYNSTHSHLTVMFCRIQHIAYFAAYNGIFKIAYAEICCICKNSHICHIFLHICHIFHQILHIVHRKVPHILRKSLL